MGYRAEVRGQVVLNGTPEADLLAALRRHLLAPAAALEHAIAKDLPRVFHNTGQYANNAVEVRHEVAHVEWARGKEDRLMMSVA